MDSLCGTLFRVAPIDSRCDSLRIQEVVLMFCMSSTWFHVNLVLHTFG